MGLEELDLVEAEHFLDDDCVGVGGSGLLGFLLPQTEDVLKSVQGHLRIQDGDSLSRAFVCVHNAYSILMS